MNKNVLLSVLTALVLPLAAQNIVKDADCNENPLSQEFGQAGVTSQASLSQYIEDKTWNRCLKFELKSYHISTFNFFTAGIIPSSCLYS